MECKRLDKTRKSTLELIIICSVILRLFGGVCRLLWMLQCTGGCRKQRGIGGMALVEKRVAIRWDVADKVDAMEKDAAVLIGKFGL